MSVTLADIQAARQCIGSVIYRSPCPYSLSLSQLCHSEIFCKLDHLQMTGSFKERGARNKLMLLTPAQRAAGVVAASAGNHALGLSYHGRELGIPVTVVMPRWAPLVKVSNCRTFGAEVILHGEDFDSARSHALQLSQASGRAFIPAFDDPQIIAGQGTMALEILEDVPHVANLIVPVGGGGLLAGVCTVLKALRPQTRIFGVEAANAPSLHASLTAGKVTRVTTRPTLADGLAVAEMGQYCFDLIRGKVDEVVLVEEPEIATAILQLLELEKTVVEGAGAVSLAAATQLAATGRLQPGPTVLILCGGNIDVTILSRIIERGLAQTGRMLRLDFKVADRPGSLARLLEVLAAAGANVKEIFHERLFGPRDVAMTEISITMETRDLAHVQEVLAALTQQGIEFNRALANLAAGAPKGSA
jgi:threonine dehydratase